VNRDIPIQSDLLLISTKMVLCILRGHAIARLGDMENHASTSERLRMRHPAWMTRPRKELLFNPCAQPLTRGQAERLTVNPNKTEAMKGEEKMKKEKPIEIEYDIAFVRESGEWDVVATIWASSDDEAEKIAESRYPDQEWFVLLEGENING